MDMEQRVEQRARALYDMKVWTLTKVPVWANSGMVTREGYRRIARAELEREGRLANVLRNIAASVRSDHFNGVCCCKACQAHDALTAYEAEFAPKPRTVEQIARDVVAAAWEAEKSRPRDKYGALLDELAAALKREGGE